ncbi:MAG: hypothetical protein AAGJ50_01320, partial [Pseudomonadota bacterium]
MRLLFALACFSFSMPHSLADDGEHKSRYVRATIGLNGPDEFNAVSPLEPGNPNLALQITEQTIETQAGITAGAAIGYDFARNFSLEAEYRFFRN